MEVRGDGRTRQAGASMRTGATLCRRRRSGICPADVSENESPSAGPIWERAATLRFKSEADVEQWLVGPLLEALGYQVSEIRAKPPITFQEGRVGRRPEADFIVYFGPLLSRDTSLIVVEAKKPGESLVGARRQAESYAFNVRAPFLLLTDGVDLEIWQLQSTQETLQVFTCKVADLAENRGRIESLIGRDAAADHCRSLLIKPLPTPTGFFEAYERAELQRIGDAESVPRTLKSTGETVLSTDFTACLSRSIVVAGPSGYGKSTLAEGWHKAALAQRLSSGGGMLSVDVQLPDVAAEGGTIVGYALNRIRAHAPSVGEATLRDSMRADGVLFLCDRMDRVPADQRAVIEAEIRNLLRDFPRCVVIVFDRNGGALTLTVPELALEALNREEQRALADLVLGQRGALALHAIPESLEPLAAHPLLLTRVMDAYGATGEVQRNLSALFEAWIDQLLERRSRPPTEYASLRQALQAVAMDTIDAPLPLAEAIELLRAEGHEAAALDELVSTGAVVCTANVEVSHETLADYLRACAVYSGGGSLAAERIDDISISRGSLLPSFLVELAPTPELQGAAWGRLLRTDLRTYVEALRSQGDVSAHYASQSSSDASRLFLTDLVDGVSEPIRAFFPQSTDRLALTLTGAPTEDLAITGTLSEDLGQLTYALRRPSAGGSRVTVGFPEQREGYHGINLGLSRYRLDSGRLIGFERLRDAVGHLVRRRWLAGGPLWANERLLARMRYLEAEYRLPFSTIETLCEIEDMLTPHQRQSVGSGGSDTMFPIAELFDDIAALRSSGHETVDRWWGAHEKLDLAQPDTARTLVDEHWRRAQGIYREVVEHNFAAIADQLLFYRALPVRYKVALYPSEFHGAASSRRWIPVATWDEAGADVEISPTDDTWSTLDHFERAREDFARLGREGQGALSMAQCSAPRFDGHSLMRFSGETSTLRDAMLMLTDDLERIMGRAKSWAIDL